MNARLIGVSGPLQGTLFALPEGEASIGRETSPITYSRLTDHFPDAIACSAGTAPIALCETCKAATAPA
jgi:hypothetical protein